MAIWRGNGVKSVLLTNGRHKAVGIYLHAFTQPEIAEVFCRDGTFQLRDVDQGRMICLDLPQRYLSERRFVGTFLKLLRGGWGIRLSAALVRACYVHGYDDHFDRHGRARAALQAPAASGRTLAQGRGRRSRREA